MSRITESISKIFKGCWEIFASVLGFILCAIIVLIIVVNWLGFFGIIPQGDKTDDRYFDEQHQPFR